MTISQSLKFAVDKLTAKKINLPHLEAEILLSEILKKPREFILAHGERALTKPQITDYKLLIKKRLKGMPIAYITGEKEFYGLKFKVNKNVLIPRPETELMVEEALKLTADGTPAAIIDVGTGSGCVIITLAKQIANCEFLATDISAKALAVAGQNAKLHGVAKKIKFLKGDLLEPIAKILDSRFPGEICFAFHGASRGNDKKIKLFNPELIITANLPYGWKAWKNNTSIDSIGLKFEPKIALYADKNGLELYEKLFKQIKSLRVTLFALCEIDPRQTKMIKKMIKKELPQAKFQIKKDLSGLNRLAIIKIA